MPSRSTPSARPCAPWRTERAAVRPIRDTACPTTRPRPARPDAAGSGRLLAGTSGFAYPGWLPRFYPAGTRPDAFLAHYAATLPAVELNNTYYQQPSGAKVAAWLAATPPTFRFTVKAQRGGTFRTFGDPDAGMDWLTAPYRAFGERLGTVLVSIPGGKPDPSRLASFLARWPTDLRLTMQFQDPAWLIDETLAALRHAGAAWCTTEGPDDPAPPDIHRTGSFLYLRLRRHDYTDAEVDAWAGRLEPFLSSGMDAFVFFRHDDAGRGPELALALAAAVTGRLDGAR